MLGVSNNDELLKYALDNGIINASLLEEKIASMKKEEIIKNHPYKIWEGANGYWYTYLPKGDKDTPIQKRSKSLDKLKECIYDFYMNNREYRTIIGVFNEWHELRYENAEIAKNSYQRYSNDFKRFFLEDDEICKKHFNEISESDIEAHIKMNIKRYSLKRKGYEGMRTILMGIFKYAKSKKYTSISISTFFADLAIPRTMFDNSKKKSDMQCFSETEEAKLVEYLWDNPTIHNLGILVLFYTGLRVGELCALQPKDVFQDHIHVNKTEIYYKSKETGEIIYEVKDNVKMNSDERDVIITKEASEVLRRVLLKAGFNDYLFMKDGNRIHGCRFNYHLGVACKKVGIKPRSTHCIRKTYASKLIDAGVDESLVCAQMGHTDIATTRNYYYFARQSNANKKDQIFKALSGTGNIA